MSDGFGVVAERGWMERSAARQASPEQEAAYEAENRRVRLASAYQVLTQAKKIRADAALMAELREFVRAERDAFAAVLDDLG
jgi:hypothetical protein